MHDDVQISCGTLPFCLYPWDKYNEVRLDVQMQTANEILNQYNTILERLVKTKADPLEIVRLWIRTEKLLIEYTSEHFTELLSFQARLRMHIDRAARMLRRWVIRNALNAPHLFDEFYREALNNLDGQDQETREDFEAVCTHIDHGRDIFFNLRGRDNEEVAQELRAKRRHELLKAFENCPKP
jgi:hypothetical protein